MDTISKENTKIVCCTDMSYVVILTMVEVEGKMSFMKRKFKKENNTKKPKGIQMALVTLRKDRFDADTTLNRISVSETLFFAKKSFSWCGFNASLSLNLNLLTLAFTNYDEHIIELYHFKITPNSTTFPIEQLTMTHAIPNDNHFRDICLNGYNDSGDILILQSSYRWSTHNTNCYFIDLNGGSESITSHQGGNMFIISKAEKEFLIHNTFERIGVPEDDVCSIDILNVARDDGKLSFEPLFSYKDKESSRDLHIQTVGYFDKILAVVSDTWSNQYSVLDVFGKTILYRIDVSFLDEYKIYHNFHQVNWRSMEFFLRCRRNERYYLKCIPLDQSFPSLFKSAREKVFETYGIKELRAMNLSRSVKTFLNI